MPRQRRQARLASCPRRAGSEQHGAPWPLGACSAGNAWRFTPYGLAFYGNNAVFRSAWAGRRCAAASHFASAHGKILERPACGASWGSSCRGNRFLRLRTQAALVADRPSIWASPQPNAARTWRHVDQFRDRKQHAGNIERIGLNILGGMLPRRQRKRWAIRPSLLGNVVMGLPPITTR